MQVGEFIQDGYNKVLELDKSVSKHIYSGDYVFKGLDVLMKRITVVEACLHMLEETYSKALQWKAVMSNKLRDLQFDLECGRAEKLKTDLNSMVSRNYSWDERKALIDVYFVEKRMEIKNKQNEFEELEAFCKILVSYQYRLKDMKESTSLLVHIVKQNLEFGG